MATATKPRRSAVFRQQRYDYIALKDAEFGWDSEFHLPYLKYLWDEQELHFSRIAKIFRRPEVEVICLIMDQIKQKKIQDRPLWSGLILSDEALEQIELKYWMKRNGE